MFLNRLALFIMFFFLTRYTMSISTRQTITLNFMAKIHYPLLPLKLISKYKFETYKYIKDVKCKVYLFHGKLNKLISYKNSIKLYESSKENTDLLLISDGNHYNLINNSLYLNKIKEICKQKKS